MAVGQEAEGKVMGKLNVKRDYPKYSNMSMKKLREMAESSTGWDRAIAMAKLRIIEIKMSITAFEEFRDNGDPFPGEDDEKEK